MGMESSEIRVIVNIVVLGFSFLLLFGAFQTSSMFQTIVLNAARNEVNSTFTGDGLTSLGIIYITFAFANWLAPVVIVLITPKYSMFFSAILYVLFIASFLQPMVWSLYLGSFLVGVAAAVLWTGQGNFLSINSNTENIGRNTSIFWALFQSSLIFGNIFQYVMFQHSDSITKHQRIVFYSVFTVVGGLGSFLLLFLRKPLFNFHQIPETLSEQDLEKLSETKKITPLQAFLQSFRLIRTETILLLLFVFAYTGFELTFFSGVYGTSVGQTKHFGDKAKGYVGLIGIMIGLGEITSTLLFNFLSRIWKKMTPDFIIIIGLFVHVISYYLIFLSLPFDSTQRPSSEPTYMIPRAGVVIFCGYLLGFADSIFNTQIMSLLGDAYKGIDSPSAFALFKFMQSLASGIAFFYSTYLTMQWQLLILTITGIMGTVSFIFIERKTRLMIINRNIESFVNES